MKTAQSLQYFSAARHEEEMMPSPFPVCPSYVISRLTAIPKPNATKRPPAIMNAVVDTAKLETKLNAISIMSGTPGTSCPSCYQEVERDSSSRLKEALWTFMHRAP